eukprot:TRINITY_DN79999_c0_g1_i1.p1 TRINITY_DN79999_c0_g1~~TRINITY_DN79999_c0_g1_i1.p1  ORF type:complete len:207 (-),score=52.98 TRINITY_DN79999_c0_g1_i1:44-640(-)
MFAPPGTVKTFKLDEESFVDFVPDFIGKAEADALLGHLLEDVEWRTVRRTLFGKSFDIPRLQSWMSDKGVKASLYQKEAALQWSPAVLAVRKRLEERLQQSFDYVLLNQYRNGKDKIAPHSDGEADVPGKDVIASISLGAERRFVVKPKNGKETTLDLRLPHGSLVVMRGKMQRGWVHAVPPEARVTSPRVNLTFRKS